MKEMLRVQLNSTWLYHFIVLLCWSLLYFHLPTPAWNWRGNLGQQTVNSDILNHDQCIITGSHSSDPRGCRFSCQETEDNLKPLRLSINQFFFAYSTGQLKGGVLIRLLKKPALLLMNVSFQKQSNRKKYSLIVIRGWLLEWPCLLIPKQMFSSAICWQ